MQKPNPKVAICIALWLGTWALFWPVANFEFLNYDDDDYVTEQLVVQEGLSWKGIAWAFTHIHAANWHPLTSISHMLDCEMFGLSPRGPHLVNVFLHATNAVLLLLLLRRISGAHWPSIFAAAVFAWHPLHVESVAWIAERKDVLSTFFWLLTTLAYCRYVESKTSGDGKSQKFYAATLLLFALGLMSKPMVVTLPFTLLLLDFWPLERFTSPGGPERTFDPAILKRLIIEKLPMFVLTLACCIITFLVQNKAGAVQELERFSISVRLGNAVVSYIRYIGKMLWPADLAALYEHQGAWPPVTIAVATLLLIGISVLAVKVHRSAPFVATGWLWFLGTLVPVIGLVQVGVQSIADRYMYVPMIGLLIIAGWGASRLAAQMRLPSTVLTAGAVMILSACFATTKNQLQHWHNSEALWTRAVGISPDSPTAHLMLASVREQQGRIDEAIRECKAALQINSNLPQAYYNLGNYAWGAGRLDEAVEQYESALKLNPNLWAAHNNLGIVHHQSRRPEKAFYHASEAVRLNPDHPPTLCNLALHHLNRHEASKAIEILTKTIAIDPEYAEPHRLMGNAYSAQERFTEAIAHYQAALQLGNPVPEAHFNLGNCLRKVGRTAEARDHFEASLRLRPDFDKAREQLRLLDLQP